MTKRFFTKLDVYRTVAPQSAAMNMAIDEALLERVTVPSIRFYGWESPALSFGYFGRFTDVSNHAVERDLVRRWTGGGIVLHGDDLTYSIVIPMNDAAFDESSMSIYEKIHRALCVALAESGQHAVVAAIDDRGDARSAMETGMANPAYSAATGTGIADPGYSTAASCNHCFANPVRADVLINGRKIAGAAQRRTRRGLLQQGSIQGIQPGIGLAERFAEGLSDNREVRSLSHAIQQRAREIAERKYASDAWLRKR
jgi:lipoyl(octanoyl) transferase